MDVSFISYQRGCCRECCIFDSTATKTNLIVTSESFLSGCSNSNGLVSHLRNGRYSNKISALSNEARPSNFQLSEQNDISPLFVTRHSNQANDS
jgi:hypothetical protein